MLKYKRCAFPLKDNLFAMDVKLQKKNCVSIYIRTFHLVTGDLSMQAYDVESTLIQRYVYDGCLYNLLYKNVLQNSFTY